MSNLDLVNPEESVILIVDDLKQNLKLLNIILESAHYQTSLALSGKDALERLKVLNPDLILLDLMMPDISGLEVCRRIKSNPEYEDIPVIFLTASVEENHLIEAYSLGANDYVNKPFRKPELLARIKTQLTLRKQSKLIQELLEKIESLQNSQHNK
ncbi:response regulator [Cyanobacterium aponinum UTEX 3222]|uniref:Response regulator receiver protein n=3 Tax=Cyanobacterium aponinum TaxID=379064 RepID=K9Z468_CYAAP|nr:response regulator [Cyanobacterium aponinum]WRL41594.1 response regulator [Cyanobacterium aponinum UTEX 3222]AFZ53537.1 response regulator receiver protein [Cyanobacterium aponinum PCC 10605]MBD2395878.1 response regulator [Cyanobacterium aponinum FACHB-4101]MTF38459.1 response regulator [Cyanobacterium aponinum 0216]PHV63497.1 response regulator [Cyanobacterium aponinum IPPAS B-1201]